MEEVLCFLELLSKSLIITCVFVIITMILKFLLSLFNKSLNNLWFYRKANLLISTETDEEAEENSSFYSNPSIFNVTNEPVSNKNFYNITTVGQMSRNKQNSHTSLIPINEQIAARMNKTKDKDKFDKWNLKQDFSQEQLFPSNL